MDNPVVVVSGALTGIARAILFLASDVAPFVTAQIVSVGGGKNGGLMPNPQRSGTLS